MIFYLKFSKIDAVNNLSIISLDFLWISLSSDYDNFINNYLSLPSYWLYSSSFRKFFILATNFTVDTPYFNISNTF